MPDPTTGQPLIFAIDDEPQLLEVLEQALESAGYRVTTARHPLEALRVYEQEWRHIDLVLLDYLMPDMTGDLVFEQLRLINPDVRVLMLTACDDQVVRRLLSQGLRGFIAKPFFLDELQRRIAEELEQP